jgi:hypothetical protein
MTRAAVRRARKKFLAYFPDGFRDETYVETERAPKWRAHLDWTERLGANEFAKLLEERRYAEIARQAVRIESRTYLLFSFEKMALRDAVRTAQGARLFAESLYEWLYVPGPAGDRFDTWTAALDSLPRRQTRVRTWPVTTVFGFIARPRVHMYVKPTTIRAAADAYDFPLEYSSRPDWATYRQVLALARAVGRDIADLRPRDMIDIQGFLWVLGSDEYPD